MSFKIVLSDYCLALLALSAAVGFGIPVGAHAADTVPPSSAITAPTSGAVVSGSSYSVTGMASDGGSGVSLVEVSVDGGAWVAATTTVDSAGDVGYYTSIALDDSGKAHISYSDATNGDLKYATNASGTWVTATVDSVGDVGYYTSIALDASGNAHISYYDATNGDLKYATNASGTWVTATVDSAGDVGYYTSIALAASGKAHISYYNATNDDLKYATNASGTWVTETVDSAGNVGGNTSIALDGNAKARISYSDWTNGDLKYATNASGTWVTATVDSVGNVGGDTSIALDGSGNAHISYCDNINHDLKYATNASGTWVTATVDSAGDVGYCTSIALGGNGKARISYSDYTNGDLKYATNVAGTWVTLAVDSAGDVGRYTSIALDGSGKARISYYDYTNGDLKYVDWDTWVYPWDTTALSDGSHTIRSRATDNAGNVETPGAGVTVTVDKTAPASAITDPADGADISGTSYTITGTAGDGAGSGVSGVEVSTNSVDWYAATDTSGGTWATWSYDWTIPTVGTYTIRSRATDNTANVQTPGPGINVSVFDQILLGNPELSHYVWDAWLSGGDCTVCHQNAATFLAVDYRDEPGFCRSCHNAAGPAHEAGLTGSRGHSIMASVTSASCIAPGYGNITSGEYDNRPFANLYDTDKVVCVTCHNAMRKTEYFGRTWEYTTTSDNLTYTLQLAAGWPTAISY